MSGLFRANIMFADICAVKGTESIPTVSSSIGKLRQFLSDNKSKDNAYGKAANGTLPLVVHADNKVHSRISYHL